MQNPIKKLYFTLSQDPATNTFSVGVYFDDEEVYRFTNFKQLSKSLGFSEAAEESSQVENNFNVNIASTSNESTSIISKSIFASPICFQSKMTEFIFENSTLFREKYSAYFASLVGTCHSRSMLNSAECLQCYRHPSKNFSQA